MPIVEKIHRVESAQCAFLGDTSKSLVFSDVFKNQLAISTYSSRAKMDEDEIAIR